MLIAKEDLSKYKPKSGKIIKLECDYCHCIFDITIRNRHKQHKKLAKDCCKQCSHIKQKEINQHKYWTHEEIEILKNNYPTCDSLCNIGINKSISSISNYARYLGLYKTKTLISKNARKNMNHDFFSEYNTDTAYYAGLIAGDGSISKYRHLDIAMTDKECIYGLCSYIKYTDKVRIRIPKTTNRIPSYRLSVKSEKMCDDLSKYWNINHNKSLTLLPPPINSQSRDIILSFIVGYIDADGWIYMQKDGRLNLGICGTLPFVEWIKNQLLIDNKIHRTKTKEIYKTEVHGPKAIKLYNMLKLVKTPDRMIRKWKFDFSGKDI